MKDLLHEPILAWLLAGVIVSLILTRTRFAKCSLMVVTLVLFASVEVTCFDGKRHLTSKFDATFFVWGRAVEVRAAVGVAFVVLGGPLGTIVSTLVGRAHGALLGLMALGPFGLGLIASSVALQVSLRTILAEGTPPEVRFGQLRTAIAQSTWLVGAGTIASVVACVAIAVVAARARSAHEAKDSGG